MNDIITIKDMTTLWPYLKKDTISICLTIIVLYILYIVYIRVYHAYFSQETLSTPPIILQKLSVLDEIINLSIEDTLFFEKLSFIIRSYLETSGKVGGATKKTLRDIRKSRIPHEILEVLEICTYYEYTGKTANDEKKEQIIERLKKVRF